MKERKEHLEKKKAELKEVTDKMKLNTEAIEELTKAYSSHLFESKYKEPSNDPSIPSNIKTKSLSIIPVKKYDKLSSETKKIIREGLDIAKENADIPYIVNTLVNENTKLAKKLTPISNPGSKNPGLDWIDGMECEPCKIWELKIPKATNDFSPDTRGEVNVIGNQDLLIVRQELLKYKPGEIAHIENVLRGEFKNKEHRKLHRTEETIFEETEQIEETEEELQTTNRFELQSEASTIISEDTSKEAGVTVTSRGWVDIEAHGNYSSNKSTEESRRTASTIAKDIVKRSVQRIKERVLKRRSRTVISEVEIMNKHGFDNTKQGAENVTGIYRWVDKFYKAQIVNYGKRVMLEFMVPEPAAFYRFASSNKSSNVPDIKKPDEPGFCRMEFFTNLNLRHKPLNYMCFVAKYQVNDVSPPPNPYINLSWSKSI